MVQVKFGFDDEGLKQLKDLTERREFDSMGETIRDALRVYLALDRLAEQGYTELIAENGRGNVKTVHIPRLHSEKGWVLRVRRIAERVRGRP